MINDFYWIMLRWYFFNYIVFIYYLIIDTNNWLCISFFLQSNWCIKWTFGLKVDTRKVWIFYIIINVLCIKTIWFATFDVYLTVVHLLFLVMYKIFLTCFLLDDGKNMTIYFTFVKYYLTTIKIEIENWEDVQYHEHRE